MGSDFFFFACSQRVRMRRSQPLFGLLLWTYALLLAAGFTFSSLKISNQLFLSLQLDRTIRFTNSFEIRCLIFWSLNSSKITKSS